MRDIFDHWSSEGDFEHEIAYGHMGREFTNRQHRKHAIALGILSIGRNVCFKKDSAPAPAPDPQIGQAAAANAQLGREWLDYSKTRAAEGDKRQDVYDSLIGKVIDSQMGAQDTANQWAQQDRDIQAGYRDKYDKWADEDRATQLKNQAKYDTWATEDRQLGRDTKTRFDQMGESAAGLGQAYRNSLDAIAGGFDGKANDQFQHSQSLYEAYDKNFTPVNDQIVRDALTWDSKERLESEAAKSRADIVAGAEMAKQAQSRQMASMGVNPNSGRFNATSRANELSTQLAAAGAENVTRDNVRNQAQQLRGQAAQLGQQVLGQSNSAASLGLQAKSASQGATQAAYATGAAGESARMQATTAGLAATGVGNTAASLGLGASGNAYSAGGMASGQQGGGYQGISAGLSAGSSAVGNYGAGNQSFIANNGIMNSGFAGGMQGYANQGNILNNLYGSQINAWGQQQQANAAQSAGTGQMIGTAAGVAAAFMM